MKKFLLSICFVLCLLGNSKAQDILVNRYFNSGTSDGTNDVVELVVVKDRLDIRKYIIKDYANGTTTLEDGGAKFRFKDIPLWSNLRSGTVIVLRKLVDGEVYTPDADASDFIINVGINDANYLTDMAPTKAWNLTTNEAIVIRADTDAGALADGVKNAVHALGLGHFYNKATWNSISSPKALLNTEAYLLANNTKGVVYLTNPNQASYTTPFDPNANLVALPLYWQKETALMTDFPVGIQVFRATTPYMNKEINAYAVVFDPKLVEFKPTYSAAFKTPQSFVTDEPGTVLACLNGGFFFTTALSHIQYNSGTALVANTASLNRSVYNGTSSTYYPTRGTFGLSPTWQPDITWTYKVGNDVYSYPVPSPNNVNAARQPKPTAAGGTIWNVISAIGGSPVLVKNGVVNVTSAEELADLDNTDQRGRSAIGYTSDGKVILLAVEGGNTTVSPNVLGLNLNDLANLMKDMGCVGALNLDGGGSTTLRINNQITVRPSNSNAVERTMPGVILIKAKN